MIREEFNNIIKTPSKEKISEYNITAYRGKFNKRQFDEIIWDLNYWGNQVFSNEDGDTNLRKFYSNKVFTEEECNTLLPYIFYRDFNKAFDKLVEKVLPLFNRIPQYWGDLHLEIWQGIFSFGTHWWVKDKSSYLKVVISDGSGYIVTKVTPSGKCLGIYQFISNTVDFLTYYEICSKSDWDSAIDRLNMWLKDASLKVKEL